MRIPVPVRRGRGLTPTDGAAAKPPVSVRAIALVLAGFVSFFAVVFIPAGLAAVAFHDGMSEEPRIGLGRTAPLAVRVFVVLERWTPWLLAIVAVVALVRAALPRRSRKWLIGVAGLGVAVGVGSQNASFSTALLPLGLALLAILGIVEIGTVLSAGWLTSRTFRWTFVGAVVILGALRLGADLWGGARLAAYDERWEEEARAERERQLSRERPVLRGTPLDEHAAFRYSAVFDALAEEDYRLSTSVCNAARVGPLIPLDQDMRAELVARNEDLHALREATRCRHSIFSLEFQPSAWSGRPPFSVVGRVGCTLALDGHRRAQSGDLAGAAETYLDVIRFGGDIAQGPLINTLYRIVIEKNALESLGKLLLTTELPGANLREMEDQLDRLEPARASIADGVRYDRLLWGDIERAMDEHPEELGLPNPPLLSWLVPYRALVAHAVWTADPLHRQLESAVEASDRGGVEAAERALHRRGARSLNPLLRTLGGATNPFETSNPSPIASILSNQSLQSLTWFRLVRAAMAGCVSGSQVEDPFAPGESLHCSSDGDRARLERRSRRQRRWRAN